MHTTVELLRRTIETHPLTLDHRPLCLLLAIPGVRSVDPHRYQARLNLVLDTDPDFVEETTGRA